MSVKSTRASGARTTVLLRADIGVRSVTLLEALVGVQPHAGHELGGEGIAFSTVELVETGSELHPDRSERMLLVVQQTHRFADHVARIREVAGFHFLADVGFDVWG
jgi:hypothetical protein